MCVCVSVCVWGYSLSCSESGMWKKRGHPPGKIKKERWKLQKESETEVCVTES